MLSVSMNAFFRILQATLNCQFDVLLLTSKEALAVYYTVIKHDGHLRTRKEMWENIRSPAVFSRFVGCSQMPAVFYIIVYYTA